LPSQIFEVFAPSLLKNCTRVVSPVWRHVKWQSFVGLRILLPKL